MPLNRRNWRICAGLLGLLLLTQWNWFGMPFERDEGEYAYSAWILRNGGVPYRDAFLQKPPMIIFTYAAAQALSETSVWPPRLLAFGFVVLTLALVGWIARQEYGQRCGWTAAWLFIPILAFHALSPFAANTEKFMILPLMATVALHLQGRHRPGIRVGLAAGACAALAVLYKPICLPVLGAVFLAWTLDVLRDKSGGPRWPCFILSVLAGGIATSLLVLAVFIRHHAFGDLWEATVAFNQDYARHAAESRVFLLQLKRSVSGWWPLVLAIAWFCRDKPARRWYWGGLLFLSLLVAHRDPHRHYYIMAAPFAAVMAARGLTGFSSWRLRRSKRDRHLSVAIAAVAALLLPVAPWTVLSPAELARKRYGYNPFIESAEVAAHLAACTSPSDSVYVAGSEPQILFHAKRRSTTRFVIAYPLMIPTRFALPYQEEVRQALEHHPPAAIVLANVETSWLPHPRTTPDFFAFLKPFLDARYHPAGRYVWNDGRGAWIKGPESPGQGLESLILYRRNE